MQINIAKFWGTKHCRELFKAVSFPLVLTYKNNKVKKFIKECVTIYLQGFLRRLFAKKNEIWWTENLYWKIKNPEIKVVTLFLLTVFLSLQIHGKTSLATLWLNITDYFFKKLTTDFFNIKFLLEMYLTLNQHVWW